MNGLGDMDAIHQLRATSTNPLRMRLFGSRRAKNKPNIIKKGGKRNVKVDLALSY